MERDERWGLGRYIYIEKLQAVEESFRKMERGEIWRLGQEIYRIARCVKLSHNFTQTPPNKPQPWFQSEE